jgi:N-acetylmuramoyl-L-alanine amidase
MNFRKKYFLKGFARFSPFFAALAIALIVFLPAPARAESTTPAATTKQQAAEAQFTRAEEQRASLESKPSNQRTLAEYKQAVSSYRRVYLITPHSSSVPDALLAVAELYTEMGDHFGRSYYQSSVEAYQFLIHEYPTCKYREDATLRIAKLQSDQLGDTSLAYKTYQDFLKRYPRSSHLREAQEALAEVSLLLKSGMDGAASSASAKDAPSRDTAPNAQSADDQGGARDARSLPRNGEIPRVRRISTSATRDSTRVTIDLEDTVQYHSARINKPDRIFFDLNAARLTPELARGNIHVEGNLLKSVRVAQNQAGVVRVVLDVNGVKDYTASLLNGPTRLVIDLYASERALRAAKAKAGDSGGADAAQPDAGARAASLRESSRSKSVRSASEKPDLIRPVKAAKPTRDGESTLTRALGLKIGRIVIDPGHGGHDTGTIGPTGLMEKDLCLDIALRLGKIIHQKLPGAEVIYTRSDDTFVPLEERTRIANEAKADLFISIHANSSHDRQARGIETYYLNLKGTPEAMEVAARENATSQEGVHDLQDLVKQIAQTEKIDESREFAEDVQDELAKHILRTKRTARNRGVRKAPFVVLIGADMPSILTEVSFLSNPYDERMLKKPDHRQSVAEGIYEGVVSYLQSLNSVTVNLSPNPVTRSTAGNVPVEQSRNQNR